MGALENLPTELKCEVLKALPDGQSLEALIRASKMYFIAYSAMTDEILGHVTLSELAARGINLHQEASMLELHYKDVPGGNDASKVKDAIIACYTQYLLKQTPKLDIEQCYWLRYLQKIMVWHLKDADGKTTFECSHRGIMDCKGGTRIGIHHLHGCKLINTFFEYTPREWKHNYPGWSYSSKLDLLPLPIKTDAGVVPLCRHNYGYRKDAVIDTTEGSHIYFVNFVMWVDQ